MYFHSGNEGNRHFYVENAQANRKIMGWMDSYMPVGGYSVPLEKFENLVCHAAREWAVQSGAEVFVGNSPTPLSALLPNPSTPGR